MQFTLRDYQTRAVESVYEHIREKDSNPCVVLPTGAGKSLVIAKLAIDCVTAWRGRVLVLQHVKELIEQNAEKIRALCPELSVGIYSAGLGKRESESSVVVAGIQSVYKRAADLGRFDVVIVDEAHLIPPDGDGMYRQFFEESKEVCSHQRIIGLTATPYRLKSGLICSPENILNEVCCEVGVKELIAAGYLSKLTSKEPIRLDTGSLHVRGGEYVAEEAERLMLSNVKPACQEIVNRTNQRNSVLIFCQGIEHAEQVKELLRALQPERVELVIGDTPSVERSEFLRDFKSKRIKYLVNVNVLTTGFDAPNVDCVALLRPTLSAGLYYQMCLDTQTEILTTTGWRTHKTILPTDIAIAADMSSLEMKISEVPIEEIIVRRVLPSEKFISIQTNSVDIRVTDKHDMIVRGRRELCWKKEVADTVLRRKSGYAIPVAGFSGNQDSSLSDDELRLIGWYVTDENINKTTNALTIVQSVNSPFIAEIQRVLDSCNLKWRTSIVPGSSSQFENASDRIHFRVSKGKPRGEDKDRRGWGYLQDYFDKSLSDKIFECSDRQVGVFLEAVNAGDGSKQANISWVKRSYDISTGNKSFAERLQRLCITHGFRCNVYKADYNANDIFILHIKPQQFRMIGGQNECDRESLKESDALPGESVWCIKNRLGTIITRRNGKVAIVGNCGRGFRLAEGKENCLVLDFAGNVRQHGPVDCIKLKTRDADGPGKAPVKTCPECESIIHAAYSVCPDCGHVFPEREAAHDRQAGSAPVLSGVKSVDEHDVIDVRYSVHEKRNAPAGTPKTMRVEYRANLVLWFSEWVCIEHEGYAGRKAYLWWKARSNDPFPKTAQRAVDIANGGGLAMPKKIWVESVSGEKFPRITRVEVGEKPEAVEAGEDDGFDFAEFHSDETPQVDWSEIPW